jgi:hypothetical protein
MSGIAGPIKNSYQILSGRSYQPCDATTKAGRFLVNSITKVMFSNLPMAHQSVKHMKRSRVKGWRPFGFYDDGPAMIRDNVFHLQH